MTISYERGHKVVRATPTCPGSYTSGVNGRFPGDSDRCAVCGGLAKVLQSGLLGQHRPPKTSRRHHYN